MRIEKLDSRMEMPQYKKLRVAAYARVSVEKDTALNSLENQTETYTEQIKANPEWEFAGVYEDKGISGTKEMRPEFQRMLADCRAGKIDMILTKSFTRFARNTLVLLNTLRELKELGIEVVFEKDNIRSLNESGELLITLLAAFAQAEAQSASENQKWRIKKAFEEGRPTGGRMLGYRFENGIFVIIPEEAEIVRQIYDDYLAGMGVCAIAKKLNHNKVPTMNGGIWHQSTVHLILLNEKYNGEMLLQKTYSQDYVSKKMIRNKGERTMYYVEKSHQAIIPKAIFEAVRTEMKKRAEKAKSTYKKPANLPFTGMITCGKCGKHYRRKINNYGTKYEKHFWVCATFITMGKDFCKGHQLPEDILIEKTKMLLGTEDLQKEVCSQLKEIKVVRPGCLIYVFADGREEEVLWERRPRGESWTNEMRQKARERAIASNLGKRNKKEVKKDV